MSNNLNAWSSAHTFYSLYNHSFGNENSKECYADQKLKLEMINESPNGELIDNNSFFKNLRTDKKHYLAHITYGLEKIRESKTLYSSGGCLVGSVYCVPLSIENKKLRLHNLGDYIFHEEARTLGNRSSTPEILIIEIDTYAKTHNNVIGIDYLKLGSIHKNIFFELEYLLSSKERFDLHNRIVKQIKESMDFLSLCSSIFYNGFKINPEHFINCFRQTATNLPILGYLYFEAVSEYILLFQDNPESKKYRDVGEFYNRSYKELMYSVQPNLKSNFKLSNFIPTTAQIEEYLISKKVFVDFNEKQFVDHLYNRLLSLVMARLLPGTENIEWQNFQWDFDKLAESVDRLIGHLIHRELRNFGRYPSLYFYFDQTKALQIWNYWNHMDVIIPFNGILPKGEIGINPAYPDLNYKIYLGKISKFNNFSYVDKVEQLDISIEPRLVDLGYTTMRNKSEHVNLKT